MGPVKWTARIAFWLLLVNLSLAGPVLATAGQTGNFEPLRKPAHPSSVGQSGLAQQLIHDVAVTTIQADLVRITQGDMVQIDVTVANLGGVQETLSVSLWDDTDAREVDRITVTLAPGLQLTIGLQWDTANASAGPHTLTATASTADDQDAGNDSLATASPIDVMPAGITLGDESGSMQPKDSFGSGLINPSLNTQPVPGAGVFMGNYDAYYGGALALVAVGTQPSGREDFFVANAGATFQPAASLRNPFLQGEIQGLVHLEGAQSSLGVYVQVRGDVHNLGPGGAFTLLAPDGTFDLIIGAPGYLSMVIPAAQVRSGQVLNVPELTLPFGDANGDGRIDILDLSMAASNFGLTTEELTPED